jgi:hypothetical protein
VENFKMGSFKKGVFSEKIQSAASRFEKMKKGESSCE